MDLKLGQKVKALRLASDLTQEELADRAGLTKGFISQFENDQTSISVDSLADIVDALGVSLSEFFGDSAEPQVVFRPDDRIPLDSKGASKFEILVPGSTNNDMDPVLLELAPGEQLEPGDPHPGEQFGFVLKGTVTLLLDKVKHRVSAKHCFYFRADKPHQLLNKNKTTAQLLWITTPPQM